MKKKSKVQGDFIEENGEGKQHTGGRCGGLGYTDGACCGDKVGDMVRLLCERRRGK